MTYIVQTKRHVYINGANLEHTGFVEVPLHLHRRLHLHVVLEEAAAEHGLVVGLLGLGLDGRLHTGLRHSGGDDQDDLQTTWQLGAAALPPQYIRTYWSR